MPVYVETSPLHRLVTIVARGKLTADEVRGTAEKLAEARVRRFAKVVEVAGAYLDLAPQDLVQLAQILRGDPDKRGPIAFVVAPGRGEFARQFAALTEKEGPVAVFNKLHDARVWIASIQHADPRAASAQPAAPAAPSEKGSWSDPDRQGTMIRGRQQREFTTRALVS
ncbi:hypothetical protein [Reyranella sp.]|uniref:hypothetical protein n=1 Tax=Reyranella sp. TaxID=1929291 RepID=UPI003D0EB432